MDIKDKKIVREIHPNDLKKLLQVHTDSEFVCTGTEFQYLCVKNELISLRILSSVFKLIED